MGMRRTKAVIHIGTLTKPPLEKIIAGRCVRRMHRDSNNASGKRKGNAMRRNDSPRGNFGAWMERTENPSPKIASRSLVLCDTTKRIRTSGLIARTTCATASDGKTWPILPPPVNRMSGGLVMHKALEEFCPRNACRAPKVRIFLGGIHGNIEENTCSHEDGNE